VIEFKNAQSNMKLRTLCIIFFPKNRAVCKKMWKSMVEPDSPQMTT